MMKRLWIDAALALLLAGALLLLPTRAMWRPAQAGVSCSVPFNLTNGTTADASQVMANYNAILSCLATSTAASGANNDITSLSALSTPLSPAQGGTTVYIGGTSTGAANAQVIAVPVPAGFSLATKSTIIFLAGFTNLSATTLNINGTGAVNVFKQTIAGPVALTGGEIVIGQLISATYDGTQYEISTFPSVLAGFGITVAGGSTVSVSTANPPYGIDTAVNLQLNVTTSVNTLIVAVKSAALNADPTAASPVLVPFKNTSGAASNTSPGPSGAPTWLSVTGALSITVPQTQVLGTANNVPFRFWIVAINNSGTVELALINCVVGAASPTQIFPLAEHNLINTGAISAAPNAGIPYSTTSRSGAPFRILGYLEFAAGLATAGTYTGSPTNVQLYGPGMKKPGDVVQTVYAANGTELDSSSSTYASSSLTATITPTSAVNPVLYQVAGGNIRNTGTGVAAAFAQVFRGASAIGAAVSNGGGSTTITPAAMSGLDSPGVATATVYVVKLKNSDNSTPVNWNFTAAGWAGSSSTMILQEIMGALEPANGNLGPLSATG